MPNPKVPQSTDPPRAWNSRNRWFLAQCGCRAGVANGLGRRFELAQCRLVKHRRTRAQRGDMTGLASLASVASVAIAAGRLILSYRAQRGVNARIIMKFMMPMRRSVQMSQVLMSW